MWPTNRNCASEDDRRGLFFPVRSFSTKASGAFGGILADIALDLISFPTKAQVGEVPADVIFKLSVLEGPVYGGILFLGLLLFSGYKLDRTKVQMIRGNLNNHQKPEEPVSSRFG